MKKKAENPASKLIEALKFASLAQKKTGTVVEKFCYIGNGWIVADNGIITVGTRIEEDLSACPHTRQLMEALSRVEGEFSITQLSETALSVTSGDFKAVVDCVPFDALSLSNPADQEMSVTIDDKVKDALRAVVPICTDGLGNAIHSAVLLHASAVATNGHALIESWHGFDINPALIPKAAVVAVTKTKKQLCSLASSQSSCTFLFSDGSFIRTNPVDAKFPDYEVLFANANNKEYFELQSNFFNNLKFIHSFSKNEAVYFKEGVLTSAESKPEASTCEMHCLPEDVKMAFNGKFAMALKASLGEAGIDNEANKLYFRNGFTRAVLMAVK